MSQRFFEGDEHASLYAQYRPDPPQELADRIVNFLKDKYDGPLDLCVDVGCGNGQCSKLFASAFKKVLATDISPSQIRSAQSLRQPNNIEFRVSPAEELPVQSGSAQIVVACTAAHWFDLPKFFTEVKRVLCINGVVALTAYFLPYLADEDNCEQFNACLKNFYIQLGIFWGEGVQHIENEYALIDLPMEDVTRDNIWTNEEVYSMAQFTQYLRTWSAFQKCTESNGKEAAEEILQSFVSQALGLLNKSTESPEKVMLRLKRRYFLLMGRNKST